VYNVQSEFFKAMSSFQEDFLVVPEQPDVVMDQLTDRSELAEARVRRERWDRNWALST
jgi:hypothetical protein